MIKKIILFVVSLLTLSSIHAQQTDTYFPYPIVPDSISTLQARTDYLISHFWDFCDLKKAFNNKQKMGEAFKEYLSFMPYASAKNAFKSIAILLKNIEKQPNDVLFLGQKAKEYVHSDTAEMYSDELFLPFARAVVENKKIPAAEKVDFEKAVRVLSATQKGMTAPSFKYTDRNGVVKTFEPDSTEVTVLFFASPDCSDCTLARSRLYADIKASKFVDDNVMRIIVINPGPNSTEWEEAAKRYPAEWEVGCSPGLDDFYDIKDTPSFYVIDDSNTIQLKNVNIEMLLSLIMKL